MYMCTSYYELVGYVFRIRVCLFGVYCSGGTVAQAQYKRGHNSEVPTFIYTPKATRIHMCLIRQWVGAYSLHFIMAVHGMAKRKIYDRKSVFFDGAMKKNILSIHPQTRR